MTTRRIALALAVVVVALAAAGMALWLSRGDSLSRKPKPRCSHAVRKPRTYRPTRPVDLVRIDTLDVRPLPCVILERFTARDDVSLCDVLRSSA